MLDRRARRAIIRNARRTLASIDLAAAKSTLAAINVRLGHEQPTRRLVRKTKEQQQIVYKINWGAKE